MKLVAITGMHRSGTSMVARVANLVGVDLGHQDGMMPAKPDNPAGFWEQVALVDLATEVLRDVLDSTWSDPPWLPDGWESDRSLDRYRTRALQLLDETFEDRADAVRGWKDPRTSVLLPFWRSVATVDDVVVVVRHPDAVCGSLATRNDIATDVSAEAWIRSLVQVLRSAPDALVLFHDEVMADPEAAAAQLTGRLGLPPPDGRAREAVRSWVDPDLVTAEIHDVGNTPTLRAARSLYASLRAGPETLGGVLDRIHAGGLAEARVAELTHSLRGARKQVRELESRASAADDALKRADEEFERLRSRRSVRAALRLAGLAKPVYSMRRRPPE